MGRKWIIPIIVSILVVGFSLNEAFAADPPTFDLMWGNGVDDGTPVGQICTSVTTPCQAGSPGPSVGMFTRAYDVAVDSAGNVYVADNFNMRIQKFDSTGAFLTLWGFNGGGEGAFSFPRGVAVDSAGNVYVADFTNYRIQKFDSSGTFLSMWGWGVDTGANVFQTCTSGTVPCQAGIIGSGDGQFTNVVSVDVDSAGNVYVVGFNDRIQKFDSSGNFLTKWGSSGGGDGQLNVPTGVAVDSAGNVYVVDQNNHRIQKFDSSGTFLSMWGWGVDTGANVFQTCTSGTVPCQAGISGSGDGQFTNPSGIDVDSAGNMYVVDSNNDRIQKFDSSGNFLTKWGSSGGGDGQFNFPVGVAVDSAGNVYVADTFNHRIQKFAKDIVIGGIYIPIDQTALLLAGVQSISMWMIPVVIAGIGIGVFVIKRKKNSNS